MGTGSNIHHRAHSSVIEAVMAVAGVQSLLMRTKQSTNAATGVRTINQRLIDEDQRAIGAEQIGFTLHTIFRLEKMLPKLQSILRETASDSAILD